MQVLGVFTVRSDLLLLLALQCSPAQEWFKSCSGVSADRLDIRNLWVLDFLDMPAYESTSKYHNNGVFTRKASLSLQRLKSRWKAESRPRGGGAEETNARQPAGKTVHSAPKAHGENQVSRNSPYRSAAAVNRRIPLGWSGANARKHACSTILR